MFTLGVIFKTNIISTNLDINNRHHVLPGQYKIKFYKYLHLFKLIS